MLSWLFLWGRKSEMNGKKKTIRMWMIRCLFGILGLWMAHPGFAQARTVTDAAGRTVQIPETVDRVICSGAGALRLLTYLQAQEKIVGVDDMEKRRPRFDARPYAMANPQFKSFPIFGEFRGHDNPELILGLAPQPQVIIKTHAGMGYDPGELQQKIGIPVVVLNDGDLGPLRQDLYRALRTLGKVVHREARAEQVIAFFDERIADLYRRTADIDPDRRPTCFVGGIAFKGPHGFQSTEPAYPPFRFVNARNMALDPAKEKNALRHSNIAKEKILEWDPDVLFLDLSSLQMGDKAGALYELKTDPAYGALTAVNHGRVFGLLPYNWYSQNYGSILSDAYFIGKCLYPDRFTDIDPAAEADAIYTVLVGRPVFAPMNRAFGGMAFKRIEVR